MKMYKAFQGPNGWYVAYENSEGFHHQTMSGGHMTERQARRNAVAANVRS